MMLCVVKAKSDFSLSNLPGRGKSYAKAAHNQDGKVTRSSGKCTCDPKRGW